MGWLHDEVINSFTFRLTKDFTDTMYCASSEAFEALLIAYGKLFGRLWKNIVKKIFIPFNPNNLHWVLIYINVERSVHISLIQNKTNELYRYLAMVHTVVRRIFHKFKKVMKSPIEAIGHTLQRAHEVVEYTYVITQKKLQKWMQLCIDFRSVRSFKITYGVYVIDVTRTFPWPTLT